ncbi:hypothetical protein EV424DRAFT_1346258 [Suillus variegatus]|nr:hypothetical protein EV424DRAFT_1346258 [Suillus variegatus]
MAHFYTFHTSFASFEAAFQHFADSQIGFVRKSNKDVKNPESSVTVKDRHTQHRNVNLSLVRTTTSTTHIIPGLLSTALGPADILTVFQMDGLNWLCDSLVDMPIRWAWYASPISNYHFLLMFNFTRVYPRAIAHFYARETWTYAQTVPGSFISDFRGLTVIEVQNCPDTVRIQVAGFSHDLDSLDGKHARASVTKSVLVLTRTRQPTCKYSVAIALYHRYGQAKTCSACLRVTGTIS